MSAPTDVFVHAAGICESVAVGPGTHIWAFAHVLPGAVIGRDANICDHVFIEGGATLGDRVTVKCYVALWEGVRVGDDVFIGPSAAFANDRYPRSRRHVPAVRTVLEKGCSIGAGAVVTRDVAPFTLVVGNPARPAGLVCRCGGRLLPAPTGLRCTQGDWTGDAPHEGMVCSAALALPAR